MDNKCDGMDNLSESPETDEFLGYFLDAPDNVDRRPYGDFFDRLKEMGYDLVKQMKSSTHPIVIVERDSAKYFLKFDWDHHSYIDGLKTEERMLGRLSGIPGVVKCVDSGTIMVDTEGAWHGEKKMPVFYIIKENLVGGPLSETEIDPAMVGQILETLECMRQKNIFLQRDADLTDFVLDETRRPVLVDFEHPVYGSRSNFRNRLRVIWQRYRMLSDLESQTPGCTDQYHILTEEDIRDLVFHSAKILGSTGLIVGGAGLGLVGAVGNSENPLSNYDLKQYLEMGSGALLFAAGLGTLSSTIND